MTQTIKLTQLQQRQRPIMCIKVLRGVTGYTLKESKEIVDSLRKINPNPVLIKCQDIKSQDLTQLGEYFKFETRRERASLNTQYRISTLAGTVDFWPVEIQENNVGAHGKRFKKVDIILGSPEIIVNTPGYDDTERMNGRWEEIVQNRLHDRGDIHYGEGIMLFQLPPNNRNIKYVAYPTSCIEVIV